MADEQSRNDGNFLNGMSDNELSLWPTANVRRFVACYLGIAFTRFEDMVTAKDQVR